MLRRLHSRKNSRNREVDFGKKTAKESPTETPQTEPDKTWTQGVWIISSPERKHSKGGPAHLKKSPPCAHETKKLQQWFQRFDCSHLTWWRCSPAERKEILFLLHFLQALWTSDCPTCLTLFLTLLEESIFCCFGPTFQLWISSSELESSRSIMRIHIIRSLCSFIEEIELLLRAWERESRRAEAEVLITSSTIWIFRFAVSVPIIWLSAHPRF